MNRTSQLLLAAFIAHVAIACAVAAQGDRWSADEIAELRGFALRELEPVPADPTNRVADDSRAAAVGERLFFDTRLSANGRASCGTCHDPNRDFQDGTPLATGVGTTNRRTMPIAATAHSPFLFWDGRKDSQWAQALGPLESAVEHGGTRAQYAHLVAVLERAFKVPSLRNVADRAPYMHAGQFATLAAVIDHYNRAPKAPAGHTELKPLRLREQEQRQLEAFLRSLSAPLRRRHAN